jgi:hypothetical protein
VIAQGSLYGYLASGLPIHAVRRLRGAKRAVTDGREVWLSEALFSLVMDERDPLAKAKLANRIDVAVVASLKHEWREAM